MRLNEVTDLKATRTGVEAFVARIELFDAEWTGVLLVVVDDLILICPRHAVEETVLEVGTAV